MQEEFSWKGMEAWQANEEIVLLNQVQVNEAGFLTERQKGHKNSKQKRKQIKAVSLDSIGH